jgi:hypothetical protein
MRDGGGGRDNAQRYEGLTRYEQSGIYELPEGGRGGSPLNLNPTRTLLTFSRTSNTSNPDKNRHGRYPPQYANAPGLHT